MPNTTFIDGEILNQHLADNLDMPRAKLEIDEKKQIICMEEFRIFDSASNAVLPNAAAADDLGLYLGTFGTDDFTIRTSDSQSATTTQKARFRLCIPMEYESGTKFNITFFAGMLTTIADTSATIDLELYKKNNADGTVGSDLVTTTAIDINSLTLAARSFTINSVGFQNGDELTGQVTISIVDGAGSSAVIGLITSAWANMRVRG